MSVEFLGSCLFQDEIPVCLTLVSLQAVPVRFIVCHDSKIREARGWKARQQLRYCTTSAYQGDRRKQHHGGVEF